MAPVHHLCTVIYSADRWLLNESDSCCCVSLSLRRAQQQAVQHRAEQMTQQLYCVQYPPQQCSESKINQSTFHRPQQVGYQSHGITSNTGPHSKMLKNNKTFILSTKFIFSWILSQDDNVSNFIVYMALKSIVIEIFWRCSKNVYSSSEPLDPVPKKGVTDTAPVRAVPK